MQQASGTRIGKTMVMRGEVSGTEDFLLDGVLDGSLTLDGGRLTVGSEGHAKAKIDVREAVIAGRVEGSVRARERAELRTTANFVGELSAPNLSIEGEARLKATLDTTEGRAMKPVKNVKAETHAGPALVAEREHAMA